MKVLVVELCPGMQISLKLPQVRLESREAGETVACFQFGTMQ